MESKINEQSEKIKNGAEKFISGVFKFFLVISVLSSVGLIIFGITTREFVFVLYSLGLLLSSLLVYNFVKVFINISNNLHKINAKLK